MFLRVMKRIYPGTLSLMIVILTLAFAFSCEKAKEEEKEKEVITGIPAPPFINVVKILPESPSSSEDLEAEVEAQWDADVEYVYQWRKNGGEIMGETKSTLENNCFFKGDTIEVGVMPYKGELIGKFKRSKPVIILNSPPVVKSASIEPSPAYSHNDLKAKVDAFDADGDYIRYTYQWKKGNRELQGETGLTLSSSYFKKGDKISYWVNVTDGESEEKQFYSGTSLIHNSPPSIDSQSSGKVTGKSLYECKIVAEDADGDSLTYKLSSAPEGMTIDASKGMIKWHIAKEQRDVNYEFKVIVIDAEGAIAIQPITLKISFEKSS
jgi:hypothetical protein